MTQLRHLFRLCLIVLGGWCGTATAQVTFEARIDTLVMLIGEQRELTLDVTCGARQKLTMPTLQPLQPLGDGKVEIVEFLGSDTTRLNDGARIQVKQRWTITAWDSAFVYLPPFEVEVDGKRYQSKSLAMKVMTVVPLDTVHVDRFCPPKDIQNNPFSWDDWKPVFWLLIINQLLAILLLWVYSRWRENKPIIRFIKRKVKLPPHQVAMNEIERIKGERKWAEEDSKEYYTQLTDTLRQYIKERYGFNATEMTSSEIIDRLLQEQDEQALAELRQLFQTADLVKFAKWTTLINENDANLVSAIDFINQTKVEVDPDAKTEEEEIPEEVKQSRQRSLTLKLMMGAVVALGLVTAAYALWLAIDLIR